MHRFSAHLILLWSRAFVSIFIYSLIICLISYRTDEAILFHLILISLFGLIDSIVSIVDPGSAKEVPEHRVKKMIFTASFHSLEETDRPQSIAIGVIMLVCLIGALLKTLGVY